MGRRASRRTYFILGEAPELRNFYVGAGSFHGHRSAGGAGGALAEWIVNAAPTMDLWPVDIRRFRELQQQPSLAARPGEGNARTALCHAMAEPRAAHSAALPALAVYDPALPPRGMLGSKMGWERANWFAEAGPNTGNGLCFGGRTGRGSKARDERGAKAAGIFDQTSFAKFLVQGPTQRSAQPHSARGRQMSSRPVGLYGMLNERGRLTKRPDVMRLAVDRFLIVNRIRRRCTTPPGSAGTPHRTPRHPHRRDLATRCWP